MQGRSQWAVWLGYLAVLAGTAGYLVLSHETPVAPPNDSFLVRWLADRPTEKTPEPLAGIVDAIGRSSFRLTPWLDDKEWRAGVARYLEMSVVSQQAEWAAPQAGRPIALTLRSLQESAQAQAAATKYQRVDIVLEGTPPTDDDSVAYLLNVTAQGRSFSLPLAEKQWSVEPLTRGAGHLSFRVMQRGKGWWPREELFSNEAGLPLAALQGDTTRTVNLASRSGDLRLRLTAQSSDVERLSGTVAKPTVLRAGSDRVEVREGTVAVEDLRASDHLFVRRSERYTAIIVIGNADLRSRVWCERDDDGSRVGVYASDVPVFAAVANGWSSLRLTLQAGKLGETLQYKVLAVSGRDLPGRQVMLEAIGRHLPGLEVDGRPVSGLRLRRTVEWLANSLDARFKPEDARAGDPPELQQLIAHLSQLSPSGSADADAARVGKTP